jgi:siroheme synthase (precorrin-2 oxidase/ferrochelatase)
MPAIVDRGDIVVAVSPWRIAGAGAAVRAAIESVLPPGLGRWQFAQRFRTAIQARIGENAARRRLGQF